MQDQLALAPAARTARTASAAQTRRTTPTAPRTRGSAGTRARLGALDATVMCLASLAVGSTGAATLVRTVAIVLSFAAVGLYRSRLTFAALDDVPRILLGVLVVLPLAGFAPVPLAWPVLALAALVVGRALGYEALRRHRRRTGSGESTLVIGTGDVAVRLAEALTEDRTYGLAPIGMVGEPSLTEPALPAPLLGPAADLAAILAAHQPRAVIVAFSDASNASDASDADLVDTLRRCRARGITVFCVPRLFELSLGGAGGAGADLVRGIPLVRMRPEPAQLRRLAFGVKRAMDVAGAGLGLLLLAPIFAVCALAVRLESRKAGVLFRQMRIGLNGTPFTILKFRSLTPATETESQVRWSINADARLGRVGKALRCSSLDELPQLLNVLRGDMSLVGPRPERPFFVDQFTRAYAGYADRHRMPVGITGWAQIHGLRGDTSIEERVRFDNYYIENWSLGMDVKIILRTVGSMLRGG